MNLVICGDSWPNGAELQAHEQCYGQLLKNQFNCSNYLNTAADSSSIPHLVIQLQQFLELYNQPKSIWTGPVVVVFFLTGVDRDMMWSCTRAINTGSLKTDPPPYPTPRIIHLNPNDSLHVDWYAEYQSKQLSNYRANTTLLALQGMCKYHGFHDYYIWGWNRVNLWPEIDQSKFYPKMIFEEFGIKSFDEVKYNQYIVKNGSHPNQLGHEKIAEILAHWIKI